MAKDKPYFANDWEMISDIDSEHFSQIPYEIFMDLRVDGWELSDDYNVIVRSTNTKTGKVKEFCYKQPDAARKKVMKLMEDVNNEILICDHEEIHSLSHS